MLRAAAFLHFQFLFVFFWQKEFGKEGVRKILLKLTTVGLQSSENVTDTNGLSSFSSSWSQNRINTCSTKLIRFSNETNFTQLQNGLAFWGDRHNTLLVTF